MFTLEHLRAMIGLDGEWQHFSSCAINPITRPSLSLTLDTMVCYRLRKLPRVPKKSKTKNREALSIPGIPSVRIQMVPMRVFPTQPSSSNESRELSIAKKNLGVRLVIKVKRWIFFPIRNIIRTTTFCLFQVLNS